MIYALTLLLSLTLFLAGVQAKDPPAAAPFEAICQPVEGNEPFFGGKAVFNTFYGRPVPLTFFLKGEKDRLKHSAIVIEAPAEVKLLEAFQENHSVGDKVYEVERSPITRDGKPYVRYRISGDLGDGLTDTYKTWRVSRVTVALDAPSTFESGVVHWSLENDGKTLPGKQFTVRFHQPLPVPSSGEQGQFRVMCWGSAADLAWHDPKLQKRAADLMLASGIRETHAFADRDSRWGQFSRYLADRGFDLIYSVPGFSIAGPLNVGHWGGGSPSQVGLPAAMGPDGKRSERYAEPIAALRNEKFGEIFRQSVKDAIEKAPRCGSVTFDFEPWNLPQRMGFGPETQAAFCKQFDLQGPLKPGQVLGQYRKQWTAFWVDISTKLLRMMADDARAVSPGVKIISYTYFRNYEVSPEEQWQQFKSCPKDPRQEAQVVDEMMFSAYHTHGRKLFDAIRMSQRHIQHAGISIVDALSRRIPLNSWVRKGDAMSPQQIYQHAVLCAAMGIRRYGLYPGVYIDGAYYKALARASRLIWAHEGFYFKGKEIEDQVKVAAADDSAGPEGFAYTAQSAGDHRLVTLFNFSDKPQTFTVGLHGETESRTAVVAAHGVKLVEW